MLCGTLQFIKHFLFIILFKLCEIGDIISILKMRQVRVRVIGHLIDVNIYDDRGRT